LVVRSSVDMEQFGGIFGLDRDDAGWFGEILVADPGLMGPVESCRGLRMIRQDNPVEVLFSFLCSANNHVRRIEVMVRHLAGYGHDGGFPDLATLARIEAVDLRRAGFGYRAERVPACAQKVLEFGGLSWLEGLKGRNAETAILELQRLPGVGPKVAECVALFGLGHLGVVPVDTHIWNAVRRRYLPDLDGSLTLARRRLVGDVMRDRFGSEAGFAHLVLFVDEMQNWRSRRRS
jgi:N-glycosylase/DNA lyase